MVFNDELQLLFPKRSTFLIDQMARAAQAIKRKMEDGKIPRDRAVRSVAQAFLIQRADLERAVDLLLKMTINN